MRWAGHMAGMREKRNVYRFLMTKPERDRLEDVSVNGITILEWTLEE
jgi:hypothetical protein